MTIPGEFFLDGYYTVRKKQKDRQINIYNYQIFVL